jgi:DNA repair exonuclease SbcCD ATPase subunit
LAEKNRYRCYIVERESGAARRSRKTEPGCALEVVQFLEDGVPGWAVETLARTILVETVPDGMKLGAEKTSVTRQGYRQDRRGGISIATEQFYCGSMGQNAAKDELRAAMARTQSNLAMLDKELAAARQREADFARRLAVQENLGKANDARRRRLELDDLIATANEAHHQALDLRRQAERRLFDAVDSLNNFERDCREQRQQLLGRRGDQGEFLDDIRDCQRKLTELNDRRAAIARQLPADQLTERALQRVPPVDELTPKYYAVRNLLEQFREIPQVGAVEVYEHHKAQYDRQRSIYREHEAGLKSWETEFRLAKEKYLVVVDHTIREYRRNVLALSELAGVSADVVLPDLHAQDDSLDQAELLVRIGYDGKRATAIGGAYHSGGQRVVSSLILLMSLATSGGISRGGFFIIDEPFAHLSLERIDDVTRFLDKTQCQFILTSPTTHNVNVFNAARLQLNFRIKRPDDTKAPVPTVIRR